MRTTTLLAMLSGCAGGGVAAPAPSLDLPDRVSIVDAAVGETAVANVALINTGTQRAELRLSVDEPFAIATDVVVVPPAGERTLAITFAPTSYEDVSGMLVIATPFDSTEVPVDATVTPDADGDGAEAEAAGGDDCDDFDADIGPDVVEDCDGIDNDCNGEVDDVDPLPQWFVDDDDDGFGDDNAAAVESCVRPTGYSSDATDCDDDDEDTFPGAPELSDGVDNDCDGDIDE